MAARTARQGLQGLHLDGRGSASPEARSRKASCGTAQRSSSENKRGQALCAHLLGGEGVGGHLDQHCQEDDGKAVAAAEQSGKGGVKQLRGECGMWACRVGGLPMTVWRVTCSIGTTNPHLSLYSTACPALPARRRAQCITAAKMLKAAAHSAPPLQHTPRVSSPSSSHQTVDREQVTTIHKLNCPPVGHVQLLQPTLHHDCITISRNQTGG